MIAGLNQCLAQYSTDPVEGKLKCALNVVAFPILKAQMLQKATEAEILARVNGRINIWACQVNPLSTSIANSVSQGTNKFSSLEDLFSVIKGSDMVRHF